MILSSLRKIGLIALVLVVAACAKVDIQSPANDSVANTKPTDFVVTFSQGTPGQVDLYLNAVKVTEHFEVTDSGATASGTDLDEFIVSGRNIFRVTTEIQNKQVTFYYDTEGPEIHILTADRDAGTVSGYLDDPAGVVSVTLDGAPVELDDALGFETTFDGGLDLNTFVAEDTFGHVSDTTFAKNTYTTDTVMSARLNNAGFEFLTTVLENEIEKIDFLEVVSPITDKIEIPLLASLEVTSVKVGRPTINLIVRDDEILDVHVNIPNFNTEFHFTFFRLFDSLSRTISVDNVLVDTNLTLDIVSSDLALDAENTAIALDGVSIEFIPGLSILNNILSGVLSGFIDFILLIFGSLFDGVIDKVASDFIKEIPIVLEFDIAGSILKANVTPSYLDTFSNGLTVDMEGSVTAPEPDPTVISTLGYVYEDGPAPTIPVQTPSGEDFDFGVAISSNFINQALLAAHESGLTTLQIRPDNTPGADPEGVSVIQSEEDDIQQTDVIGMNLVPASAPYLLFDGDDTNAMGTLVWDDVTLEFDLKRAEWEDYQNIFSARFNLEMPFELDAEDGFLVIGLEQVPEIFITESSNTGAIQLTPAFINGILKYFLPVVMPVIADQLKAVPLPRVAGYSILPRDFWVTGTGNNTLSLGGSMISIEETESAEEPTTILTSGAQSSAASSNEVNSSAVTSANGEVTIAVDGVNPNATDGILESRYRVDNGPWSIWKPRDEIVLSNLLGGDHIVEVCSRTALLKIETGCPSVSFTTAVVQ